MINVDSCFLELNQGVLSSTSCERLFKPGNIFYKLKHVYILVCRNIEQDPEETKKL